MDRHRDVQPHSNAASPAYGLTIKMGLRRMNLRPIDPHSGGVGHAQRNAAQAAAAAARMERPERDAVATRLAEHDLPGAPRP